MKSLTIRTSSSISIMFYDHILRWFVLILYLLNIIHAWVFWVFQLLIIPLSIFYFAEILSKWNSKKLEKKIRKKVNEKFKGSGFIFKSDIGNRYFLFSFIVSIIGTAISYYILSEAVGNLILILICIIVFISSIVYAFLVSLPLSTDSATSSLNKISSICFEEYENKEYVVKYEIPKDEFFQQNDTGHKISKYNDQLLNLNEQDINSIAVVRIEGKVKNMSSTADSYLLESIFLGALAFSGFLSITSERVAEGGSYKDFFSEIGLLYDKLVNLEFIQVKEILFSVTSGDNLFALISIEALLCSIFFLLVIALRLKLTSYLEKIDNLVRLGTLYHAKEEEVSNLLLHVKVVSSKSKLEQRLSQLTQNLRICISDSEKLYKQTIPVITIMVSLRNIGVSMFYLVLITSGMLFSYYFSFLIFVLAIFTFFIKELRSFFDSKKLNKILANYKFGGDK